jgi:hypothetical protein
MGLCCIAKLLVVGLDLLVVMEGLGSKSLDSVLCFECFCERGWG